MFLTFKNHTLTPVVGKGPPTPRQTTGSSCHLRAERETAQHRDTTGEGVNPATQTPGSVHTSCGPRHSGSSRRLKRVQCEEGLLWRPRREDLGQYRGAGRGVDRRAAPARLACLPTAATRTTTQSLRQTQQAPNNSSSVTSLGGDIYLEIITKFVSPK